MVRVRQTKLPPRRRAANMTKWLLSGSLLNFMVSIFYFTNPGDTDYPRSRFPLTDAALVGVVMNTTHTTSTRKTRIAGTGNSTTPNHSTVRMGAQPAEEVNLERAETAPIVDTLAHKTETTSDTVAPTLGKAYPLPTNSSIVSSDGIKQLKAFSYWGKNKFCRDLRKLRPSVHPTVFNITFGCQDLFSNSGLGTGNWMSAL